ADPVRCNRCRTVQERARAARVQRLLVARSSCARADTQSAALVHRDRGISLAREAVARPFRRGTRDMQRFASRRGVATALLACLLAATTATPAWAHGRGHEKGHAPKPKPKLAPKPPKSKPPKSKPKFDVVEATIADIHEAILSRRITA